MTVNTPQKHNDHLVEMFPTAPKNLTRRRRIKRLKKKEQKYNSHFSWEQMGYLYSSLIQRMEPKFSYIC